MAPAYISTSAIAMNWAHIRMNSPADASTVMINNRLRRAIAGAFPDARFDAGGRAELSRDDVTATFDAGPDDPVFALVVHAEGTAAASAVRTLVAATGGRIYAPKRDEFLELDRLA